MVCQQITAPIGCKAYLLISPYKYDSLIYFSDSIPLDQPSYVSFNGDLYPPYKEDATNADDITLDTTYHTGNNWNKYIAVGCATFGLAAAYGLYR